MKHLLSLEKLAGPDIGKILADAAEFVDADLKRNPRARGRFGEHQCPSLARQRLGFVMTALAFEHGGIAQNFFKIRARQFFQ